MSTQDALAQIPSGTASFAVETITNAPEEPTPAPAAVALSRQAILDATAKALAEVGYDGTTIRKIASLLNCAVGSIYRYFKDKRELLSAVAQQRFDEAAGIIESGGSFEKSARAYVDAAIDEPQTYRMMFWLACVGQSSNQSPAMVPQVVASIIAGWSRRLGDARLAQQAWAVVHGSIMLGHDREQVLATVQKLFTASARPASAVPDSASAPKAAAPASMLKSAIHMALLNDAEDNADEAEPAVATAGQQA